MSWKKISIAAMILAVAGGAIGLYMYNKPHKNYIKAKPDISITAKELINAFETDEKAANNRFLDKIVEVSGEVSDLTTSNTGEVAITLIDAMFGVTLTLDPIFTTKNKQQIQSIKIGDPLTLKGRCDGYLTDVRLSKCSFESH